MFSFISSKVEACAHCKVISEPYRNFHIFAFQASFGASNIVPAPSSRHPVRHPLVNPADHYRTVQALAAISAAGLAELAAHRARQATRSTTTTCHQNLINSDDACIGMVLIYVWRLCFLLVSHFLTALSL